jgi:hypothetical protein
MTIIVLTSSISLIIGLALGRKLAVRGITAENGLQNRQETAYIVLAIIVLPLLLFLLIGRLNLSHLIPQIFVLYLGEHLQNLMLGGGWFVLGLLIGMEWPGRRDRRRLQQLLVAIAAIAVSLAILLHYSLPVTGLLGEPLIVENIVLQTTPYTCAPASIATLARLIGTAPNLSEREAVILTGTDRFGTSTLAEISALKRLGLAPRYRRGLTVAELAAAKQPALLHVKEPVGGTKIGHTVVLLETNSQKQTFIIGNPLYGRLERTFDSMEGYWTGEAVFASGGDRSNLK